jgi:superfamily II DNA or RNA helicase
MSRKFYSDLISEEKRKILLNDLEIKIESSFNSSPTYIYPLGTTPTHCYIPFNYARKFNILRPNRTPESKMKVDFKGKLRENQISVRMETLQQLNKEGSALISCYPGFGKCLAKDTPILMYDGSIKKVQKIKIGDKIMGDDSKPRNVLSTIIGSEKMYDINSFNGNNSFTANGSHILSLKIISGRSFRVYPEPEGCLGNEYMKINYEPIDVSYLKSMGAEKISEDGCKMDISIKNYLLLPRSVKKRLRAYKTKVFFEKKEIQNYINPYFLGMWIITPLAKKDNLFKYLKRYNHVKNLNQLPTQTKIPYEYKCNSEEIRQNLLAGIIDVAGKQFMNTIPKYQLNKIINKELQPPSSTTYQHFYAIKAPKSIAEDIVYIARSLGLASQLNYIYEEKLYKVVIYGPGLAQLPLIVNKYRESYTDDTSHLESKINIKVNLTSNRYYGFTLDGNNRFLLGDFTVTHNTAMAIYLSSKIGLKTLVISHRLILMSQWKKSIQKFCPDSKIGIINPRITKNINNYDFCIVNATNVPKMPREFYKNFLTVVVDECHLIMAKGLSKCLQMLVPRYLIGLSATPYREDGLNILLDLYFGTNKIYRKLSRLHTVYKIKTNFEPLVELGANGKVNWGKLLDSQCNNIQRNEMIIRLIKALPKRNILVLCKRVIQGKYLVRRLQDEKEDVTSLIGSQQEYEQSSRILVGTCSKAGVGFDHPKLNTLIMASDILAYYIQYLGRVFRTRDTIPLVFDIVDKNGILEKHYKVRRKVYLEHGGKISNFKRNFPDFELI